jgi:hypothetical protein
LLDADFPDKAAGQGEAVQSLREHRRQALMR